MSTKKIILLVSPVGLSVFHVDRQGSKSLAELAQSNEFGAEFHSLIRAWQGAEFHLLLDLTEEDFQFESAPHLTGQDQQALFIRKLEQAYRTTPYRRVIVQQAGKRGGQDKLMLSGLLARERIDRIVNVLLEEKCAIAGIHSAALAAESLVVRLKEDHPHLMLVASAASGCLRQSYFVSQALRLSRLGGAAAGYDSSAEYAIDTAGETRRSRQYLTTLRVMGREDALTVRLVTNAEDPPAHAEIFLNTLAADSPQIIASAESAAAFAVKLGLPSSCTSWQDILLAAIARGWIKDHYRPTSAARYHQLHLVGLVLNASAIMIALICGFLAWQGFSEAEALQETINLTERNIVRETQRKNEFESKLGELEASSPAEMKEAGELFHQYIARWPDAEPLAQAISNILLDFPRVKLDKFSWQVSNSEVVKESQDEAPAGQTAAPIAPVPAVAAGQSGTVPDDGRRWQHIRLSGHFVPFEENYREVLDEISRLVKRLEALPRASVTVVKTPLDTRPQSRLSPQEGDAAQKGVFVLHLVIRPVSAPGAKP